MLVLPVIGLGARLLIIAVKENLEVDGEIAMDGQDTYDGVCVRRDAGGDGDKSYCCCCCLVGGFDVVITGTVVPRCPT